MRTITQKEQRMLLDSIRRDNLPKEVRKLILTSVKKHIKAQEGATKSVTI